MKFKGTYQDLFAYSNDLNNFAMERPAVAKLLAAGYKKFESRNKMGLNHIREKLAALYEENVEKDVNGNYVMAEGNESWSFKSKLHQESFKADWERLMNTECFIVIGEDMAV